MTTQAHALSVKIDTFAFSTGATFKKDWMWLFDDYHSLHDLADVIDEQRLHDLQDCKEFFLDATPRCTCCQRQLAQVGCDC